MGIVRVIAEGVGPFAKRLDLDFSDGKGNPHLGPHIFAGVNGSGKSTVLRAIACAFAQGRGGFDYAEWGHRLAGHKRSGIAVFVRLPENRQVAQVCVFGPRHSPDGGIEDWFRSILHDLPPALGLMRAGREHEDWAFFHHKTIPRQEISVPPGDKIFHWGTFSNNPGIELPFCAAYSPTPSLRYVGQPDIRRTLESPADNALAFESTIRNEDLQAWLHRVYYKKAMAQTLNAMEPDYPKQIEILNSALSTALGSKIALEVELEPLQLVVRWGEQRLNFSQLPDGVRATLGWVADFMMRQDLASRQPMYSSTSVLLLDEADSHLHPRWQRTLLPALRHALPHVQIIVTSHSPFVIGSCRDARIHVLDMDEAGHARAREPEAAPVGQSVMATLHDVFGVDSRFDIDTERQLGDWNELKKKEAIGELTDSEHSELHNLTEELSKRSEELRSIVAKPSVVLLKSIEKELSSQAKKRSKSRQKTHS